MTQHMSTKLSIAEIYGKLQTCTSFQPTDLTSRLFSDLVDTVLREPKKPASEWLNQDQIVHLQQMCGLGEFALESYWSKEISSSQNPHQTLQQFPYYDNYVALTKQEWNVLQSCHQHAQHTVVFCGGGPLPLTAILMAQWFAVPITILDVDKEAVDQAHSLVSSLGLQDLIQVRHCAAQDYSNYREYNTIYIAALAGTDASTRQQIFTTIQQQTSPDTHILTRSSWGARALLYQPLDTGSISGFCIQKEVRPAAPVINSILVLTPERG